MAMAMTMQSKAHASPFWTGTSRLSQRLASSEAALLCIRNFIHVRCFPASLEAGKQGTYRLLETSFRLLETSFRLYVLETSFMCAASLLRWKQRTKCIRNFKG